jgi:hypothetical protein
VGYSASSDSVWFTPRPRIQRGLLRVLGFSVVYSAFSVSVWFTPRGRYGGNLHSRVKIIPLFLRNLYDVERIKKEESLGLLTFFWWQRT